MKYDPKISTKSEVASSSKSHLANLMENSLPSMMRQE